MRATTPSNWNPAEIRRNSLMKPVAADATSSDVPVVAGSAARDGAIAHQHGHSMHGLSRPSEWPEFSDSGPSESYVIRRVQLLLQISEHLVFITQLIDQTLVQCRWLETVPVDQG